MIYLLHCTINIRKSHRQPQWTLKLVFQDRVIFVWVVLHVSLCGRQHPECKPSSLSRVSAFLFKLRSLSYPTNKNLRELCPEIHTAPPLYPFRVTHTFISTFVFSHRALYCHLPNYWLLLNHSLCSSSLRTVCLPHLTSRLSIHWMGREVSLRTV